MQTYSRNNVYKRNINFPCCQRPKCNVFFFLLWFTSCEKRLVRHIPFFSCQWVHCLEQLWSFTSIHITLETFRNNCMSSNHSAKWLKHFLWFWEYSKIGNEPLSEWMIQNIYMHKNYEMKDFHTTSSHYQACSWIHQRSSSHIHWFYRPHTFNEMLLLSGFVFYSNKQKSQEEWDDINWNAATP